jgi:hypothetical protein
MYKAYIGETQLVFQLHGLQVYDEAAQASLDDALAACDVSAVISCIGEPDSAPGRYWHSLSRPACMRSATDS